MSHGPHTKWTMDSVFSTGRFCMAPFCLRVVFLIECKSTKVNQNELMTRKRRQNGAGDKLNRLKFIKPFIHRHTCTHIECTAGIFLCNENNNFAVVIGNVCGETHTHNDNMSFCVTHQHTIKQMRTRLSVCAWVCWCIRDERTLLSPLSPYINRLVFRNIKMIFNNIWFDVNEFFSSVLFPFGSLLETPREMLTFKWTTTTMRKMKGEKRRRRLLIVVEVVVPILTSQTFDPSNIQNSGNGTTRTENKNC